MSTSPAKNCYLPPELWLHTFSYLPPVALEATTLTCHAFRELAQPLLFTTLNVCPFFLLFYSDRPILRPARYLQRTLARLQVYALPHIAPAVKHLWISPYANSSRAQPLSRDAGEANMLDPREIVGAVIEYLPAFPNIRTLSWHCIDITPDWWAAISQLPHLHRVWLNSCSLLAPILPPSPSITHLDLDQWAWDGEPTNHTSIHEERRPGIDAPLLPILLNPITLHSISVPRADTALRLMAALAELDTPCALRTLTIPLSTLYSPHAPKALAQCPQLDDLHLLPEVAEWRPRRQDQEGHSVPVLSPHVLASLKTYTGPPDLLRVLFADPAQSTALRHVKLWPWRSCDPSTCDPEALAWTLSALADATSKSEESGNSYEDTSATSEGAHNNSKNILASRGLERLHLSTPVITTELLRSFLAFPHLQSVDIDTQGRPTPSEYSASPSESRASMLELEMQDTRGIGDLYGNFKGLCLPASLRSLVINTSLATEDAKSNSSTRLSSQCSKSAAARPCNAQDPPHIAASFISSLAARNPALERVQLRYGLYWTGKCEVAWEREAPSLSEEDDEDGMSEIGLRKRGKKLPKLILDPCDSDLDSGYFSSTSSNNDADAFDIFRPLPRPIRMISSTSSPTIHTTTIGVGAGTLIFTAHSPRRIITTSSTTASSSFLSYSSSPSSSSASSFSFWWWAASSSTSKVKTQHKLRRRGCLPVLNMNGRGWRRIRKAMQEVVGV